MAVTGDTLGLEVGESLGREVIGDALGDDDGLLVGLAVTGDALGLEVTGDTVGLAVVTKDDPPPQEFEILNIYMITSEERNDKHYDC